ncbi:MAG TPA: UMP kinase [Nitrososphaera sp.]|jgi:uridylate kinase|nr:UMP kinase [Nitrososphaera sp.]
MGKERVVIKLSGRVFSDDTANELKRYAAMLAGVSDKVQPVVVAGGGKIARHYIGIARELGSDEASLDILGIEVSRLNARLLIAALSDHAYPAVPEDLEQVSKAAASGKVVVTGGLHPGQSTNATAALIAEKVKASRFLNATDVDGIYDSDPNKNKGAKMFKEVTVKKCLEILGSENSAAGAYDLMDIVALKVIERSKIPTVVLRSEPANIKNAIGNKITGTRIVV